MPDESSGNPGPLTPEQWNVPTSAELRDSLRQTITALRLEITGYEKAIELQRRGMKSMAELLDDLKQECRTQKADLAKAQDTIRQLAERCAGQSEALSVAARRSAESQKAVEAERAALLEKFQDLAAQWRCVEYRDGPDRVYLLGMASGKYDAYHSVMQIIQARRRADAAKEATP